MKKSLFLLLILLSLFIISGCDFNNNEDEVKYLTVEEGLASIQASNSHQMDICYLDNVSDSRLDMKIDVDGKKQKINLSVEENYVEFYTTVERNILYEEETYLIVNPKDLGVEYDGYVKASKSYLLLLLLSQYQPETFTEQLPDDPMAEFTTVFESLGKIQDFFYNLKNEYFDTVEKGVYSINQIGINAFKEVLSGINKVDADINYDMIIKTNETHMTEVVIKFYEESTSDPVTIEIEFKEFGNIVVDIPTNTISLEELIGNMSKPNA